MNFFNFNLLWYLQPLARQPRNTWANYTRRIDRSEEELERVTTVLYAKEGKEERIDDNNNGRPKINLSPLAGGRGLGWDDQEEHKESKGKQTI